AGNPTHPGHEPTLQETCAARFAARSDHEATPDVRVPVVVVFFLPSIALTPACRGPPLFPRARNGRFASARYSRPMSSVLSIAVSGMAAAQKRLEVSARNVANVSTTPSDEEAAAAFAALRMDQVEISGGGTAPV